MANRNINNKEPKKKKQNAATSSPAKASVVFTPQPEVIKKHRKGDD